MQKEKLLEDKFIKTLEKVIDTRKAIEHGEKKELTGREIDELTDDAEKYLKRIKRLFTQIERIREEQDIVSIYDSITAIARDVLKLEGVEKVSNEELLKVFESELVKEGKVPTKLFKTFEMIIKAKKDHDQSRISKVDMETLYRESNPLIKFLVEFVQRKRGRELERAKIKVKYGEKYGEVILLEDHAFIIHDIDAKEKEISKAKISPSKNEPPKNIKFIKKKSSTELIDTVHIIFRSGERSA